MAILLAEIIDRHDGRMLERGDRLGFSLEPHLERRIRRKIAGEDFDRHFAIYTRIVGLINPAHPATGDFTGDPVATKSFGVHPGSTILHEP